MTQPTDARIAHAEALLNDPLNREFFAQTKEAIYAALEGVNEHDMKALQSIAQMAKWRLKFHGFYQSFLETGKIRDFEEKNRVIDRLQRFWPGNRKAS